VDASHAADLALLLTERVVFRQPASLLKYLEHHGLTAKPDATLADLAILVGR
jgi:hypothetical protein